MLFVLVLAVVFAAAAILHVVDLFDRRSDRLSAEALYRLRNEGGRQ